MIKMRLNNRAKLKCLDNVRKFLVSTITRQCSRSMNKSATYVVREDEEANSPSFLNLTSAFQNLDRKVEEGFRHLDERINERMDKLETRLADMERQIPDEIWS
ncbi:hypothetical protein LIER_12200 [Lithospermum erythrorhizon]|uniref:Uncharacterized protein n=1 Tax=Lithospermum erythrorhizon TaxID=34254 RepID=A0AAV3PSB5_LITER